MRGGVTFDALGKPREFKFTTNSICRLEERAGKSLQEVLADTAGGKDTKRTVAFRLLMWAGLGDLTLDDAGDIMDDIGLAEVDRIIAEGLKLAFPPKEPSAEGNGAAAA
jgi:hypothetical protein